MAGTNGLLVIKEFGGIVVVQDPQSAESPYMPQQAIDRGAADYILNPLEITDFINKTVSRNSK